MSVRGSEVDVVVVGAGLAGLRCAGDLTAAGLDVVVLERDEVVGGRVRTDEVDGFLVDRGFQLLNPAYPALADLDVDSFELQQFGAGVAARHEGGLARLGHPLHAPGLLPASPAFLARHPGQALALARWTRPLVQRRSAPLADLFHRDVASGRLPPTLGESWDRAGVDGPLRRVLEQFLAGVLLEDEGRTPTEVALLLVSAFVHGTPGLPANGMRALPVLLRRGVPDVRLSTQVLRIDHDDAQRVVHTTAGPWRARSVVVATDTTAAGALLERPAAPMRGVVTVWFAADDDLPTTTLLHVDARRRPSGPLANTAVVSDAAPTYAGATARRLVQASAVLTDPANPPRVADMQRHAGELLGGDSQRWDVVAVHEVTNALPETATPFVARQPVRLDAGLYVCGDHRDTPSIQGALVSGRRTAQAIVSDRSSERALEV